jgi:PncC family amidohydrolase
LFVTKPIEEQVGDTLTQLNWTLALAESCTGGLIGHRITNVPGSSEYFLGGIVAYAYEAKERLLDVRHDTLYSHGAVSHETAIEMARGARLALGTDVGVSVTGIAGPGGGMPGKPIGLTWIGISTREGSTAHSFIFKGDRSSNKNEAAETALKILLDTLENEK